MIRVPASIVTISQSFKVVSVHFDETKVKMYEYGVVIIDNMHNVYEQSVTQLCTAATTITAAVPFHA